MTESPRIPHIPYIPDIPQTHRVILVRHAQSGVDQAHHPREWGLTDEGRAAARRLAALGLFDRAAGFYAGPEPKMVDTLAPAAAVRGQKVQDEPDFAESDSQGWFGGDEYLAVVRRFFAAPDQPPASGWETATAAAARFAAAVERLSARHPPAVYAGHALPGTFAVASGGRILMAYLSRLLGMTPDDAFESWRRLCMPDVAVLELLATTGPRVVIPFGTLAV